ncbi:MAG TPA: NfeD family protein [Bryobacteraceae bacterium]|nr:NfeD family protein [Bryobacteraceae bacterium]
MSWETVYLGCFWLGFFSSLLSFLAGFGLLHLPGLHAGHGAGGGQNSPVNFGTVAAFLAWFGGTGYLLTRYSNIWALLALGVAFMSGLGGAAAVFWFLVKVLLADEQELDPADYDMIGVLGRVSSPVRPGGTGEMIFSQAGARRAAPIRSENGEAIAKDDEVVVTRFEKGIAYVRRWEEMSESSGPAASGR